MGNLRKYVIENELPDVTEYDSSDKVRKKISGSEETGASYRRGTEKSEQETDEVYQHDIEYHENEGDQDLVDECRIVEHCGIVCKSDVLCDRNTGPVSE